MSVFEKISVIIPLFNKEKEITKSVTSVLAQTFLNFELIVIDDGSTDNSAAAVKSFSDKRISLFNKQNGGVSSARNYGIKKARNHLIAFLDADDWWAPDLLSTLMQLTKKFPDAGMYGGQYVQENKQNKILTLNRFPEIREGYFELYHHLYAIHSSSVLLKKEVFAHCGYFDEKLTHGEDTDMWIRIALKYKVCYTSKLVSFYNIAGNPLTRSAGRPPELERHLISKLDLYMNVGGKNWDDLLFNRKIHYLEYFYLVAPFNKKVKSLLKSIPADKLKELKKTNLRKGPIHILCLHIGYLVHNKYGYIKNRFMLLFEK